ncbi:MAG TPA: alpha/beta fold hydrolase [Symbiobacteriaceae bacterium]|jgi:pimeloyl-ACP methyl ester carboxylesterase|nr:alpha/beta fold hydrolase [Symbiobacteriaceae bacterium]
MVSPLANVTHRYADVNGVRLHYVEAGSGPLVVLLHGFPDFWYSWRHQIPALVAAGYRVVAPDMRGYNLSDKPAAVADYDVDKLAADVAGLIAACGEEKAMVAGHDWGAGVAWWFAMHHPDRLSRLAILNVPHPERMLRGLRDPRQLLRSWYMLFFQIPGLPEAVMRAGRYRVLREMMRKDPLRPGAFTPNDIDRYVEAAAQSGGLRGPINYYRALFRRGAASVPLRRIEAPVLVIWGQQDRYLRPELAEPDPKWVPDCRVERIADASHWVHMDQPDRVSGLLLDFLRG